MMRNPNLVYFYGKITVKSRKVISREREAGQKRSHTDPGAGQLAKQDQEPTSLVSKESQESKILTMNMLLKVSGLIIGSTLLLGSSLAQECDRCNYDGEDPADCKTHGLIDNTELVAWHTASQDCLDTFQLRITSPDPSLICSSATGFVNELQFGSSLTTARLGLGVSEGGFFDDNGLKDQITIDGQTYDCEQSSSSCYSAMRGYFQSDPDGQREMDDICSTLANAVRNDRQVLQSVARNRLCLEFREGTTIPDSCNPLWEQLEAKMEEYNDKDCTGFSFGTQGMSIPNCPDEENGSVESPNDENGSDESPDEGSGSDERSPSSSSSSVLTFWTLGYHVAYFVVIAHVLAN